MEIKNIRIESEEQTVYADDLEITINKGYNIKFDVKLKSGKSIRIEDYIEKFNMGPNQIAQTIAGELTRELGELFRKKGGADDTDCTNCDATSDNSY